MPNVQLAKSRIVVGVDGSPEADEALRWAAREATDRCAALEVTTCWMYPELVTVGRWASRPYAFPRDVKKLVNDAVAHVAELYPSVEVSARLCSGPPVPELVEASRGADLLIVGSRGMGRALGLVLGSVSRHCSQQAHCPVLVVRRPRVTTPSDSTTVLVGIDGSESANAALAWAVDEAVHLDAELKVLGAWMDPAIAGSTRSDIDADLVRRMQQLLGESVKLVAEMQPDLVVRTHLSREHPSHALVEASREADLLVVGSRGLGAFRGMLLGSVGQYCVSHAKCTTLVVRDAT